MGILFKEKCKTIDQEGWEGFLVACVVRGSCVYCMYIPHLRVGKALCRSEGGRVECNVVCVTLSVWLCVVQCCKVIMEHYRSYLQCGCCATSSKLDFGRISSPFSKFKASLHLVLARTRVLLQ